MTAKETGSCYVPQPSFFNSKSNLTLLSNYQMREAGLLVDDITKMHLKDLTGYGTHCMHNPNSVHTIPFITKSGLPAFRVCKPTMNECLSWPEERMIDISIENWDPQEHQEESLRMKPPIKVAAVMTSTEYLTVTTVLCDPDEDP